MAAFPSTPSPTFVYGLEPRWRTLITEFDSGEEQRRKKQLYAKYDISLSYYGLESTNSNTLYEFYQARNGAYEAFHFFDPLSSTHVNIYVGTGDGASTAFDVPGKQTTAHTLYVNGSSVGATVTTASGTDGSDSFVFGTAPTSTQILTAKFTGQLRVRCRFAEDNLSRENFSKDLFQYGIKLKGLAPA